MPSTFTAEKSVFREGDRLYNTSILFWKIMIIAFCGSSGSGKSTLVRHIKALEYFNGKEVRIKQEDDFLTLRVVRIILGSKLFLEYKEQKFFNIPSTTLGSRLFSYVVYLLYPLIVYFEFLFDHIYYEIIFREKMLLSDRYIYDYIVTFKDALGVYNPVTRFLYERFPRPYLAIFIQINKATALERNKNKIPGKITASAAFHEKILQSYSQIAEQVGMFVVGGDKDLTVSVKKIEKALVLKEKLLKIKSISISGLDGCGKTTLAENLTNYADALGIRSRVEHFYYRGILHKFVERLGQARRRNSANVVVRKKYSFIWALLVYLDSCLQYLFTFITGPNLLIFDRFFYDYLVSFQQLQVTGLWLFEKFIPQADHKILLSCRPEIAHKRKPESPIEYLRETSRFYSQLANKHNIKVVEAERGQEVVLEEALDSFA